MHQVFLSHSSKDHAVCQQLYADLLNLGFQVWYDEVALEPGDSLIEKIGSSLQSSNVLAVVLSENSVKSTWVTKEVAVALHGHLAGAKIRVVPIRLDDSDLPPFLVDFKYVDFRPDANRQLEFARLVKMLLRTDREEAVLLRLVSGHAHCHADDEHSSHYCASSTRTPSDETVPDARPSYWLASDGNPAELTLDLPRVHPIRLVRLLNTSNQARGDRGASYGKLWFSAPGTDRFGLWEGAIPPYPEWLTLWFDTIPAGSVTFELTKWHGKGGGLNCLEVYAEE